MSVVVIEISSDDEEVAKPRRQLDCRKAEPPAKRRRTEDQPMPDTLFTVQRICKAFAGTEAAQTVAASAAATRAMSHLLNPPASSAAILALAKAHNSARNERRPMGLDDLCGWLEEDRRRVSVETMFFTLQAASTYGLRGQAMKRLQKVSGLLTDNEIACLEHWALGPTAAAAATAVEDPEVRALMAGAVAACEEEWEKSVAENIRMYLNSTTLRKDLQLMLGWCIYESHYETRSDVEILSMFFTLLVRGKAACGEMTEAFYPPTAEEERRDTAEAVAERVIAKYNLDPQEFYAEEEPESGMVEAPEPQRASESVMVEAPAAEEEPRRASESVMVEAPAAEEEPQRASESVIIEAPDAHRAAEEDDSDDAYCSQHFYDDYNENVFRCIWVNYGEFLEAFAEKHMDEVLRLFSLHYDNSPIRRMFVRLFPKVCKGTVLDRVACLTEASPPDHENDKRPFFAPLSRALCAEKMLGDERDCIRNQKSCSLLELLVLADETYSFVDSMEAFGATRDKQMVLRALLMAHTRFIEDEDDKFSPEVLLDMLVYDLHQGRKDSVHIMNRVWTLVRMWGPEAGPNLVLLFGLCPMLLQFGYAHQLYEKWANGDGVLTKALLEVWSPRTLLEYGRLLPLSVRQSQWFAKTLPSRHTMWPYVPSLHAVVMEKISMFLGQGREWCSIIGWLQYSRMYDIETTDCGAVEDYVRHGGNMRGKFMENELLKVLADMYKLNVDTFKNAFCEALKKWPAQCFRFIQPPATMWPAAEEEREGLLDPAILAMKGASYVHLDTLLPGTSSVRLYAIMLDCLKVANERDEALYVLDKIKRIATETHEDMWTSNNHWFEKNEKRTELFCSNLAFATMCSARAKGAAHQAALMVAGTTLRMRLEYRKRLLCYKRHLVTSICGIVATINSETYEATLETPTASTPRYNTREYNRIHLRPNMDDFNFARSVLLEGVEEPILDPMEVYPVSMETVPGTVMEGSESNTVVPMEFALNPVEMGLCDNSEMESHGGLYCSYSKTVISWGRSSTKSSNTIPVHATVLALLSIYTTTPVRRPLIVLPKRLVERLAFLDDVVMPEGTASVNIAAYEDAYKLDEKATKPYESGEAYPALQEAQENVTDGLQYGPLRMKLFMCIKRYHHGGNPSPAVKAYFEKEAEAKAKAEEEEARLQAAIAAELALLPPVFGKARKRSRSPVNLIDYTDDPRPKVDMQRLPWHLCQKIAFYIVPRGVCVDGLRSLWVAGYRGNPLMPPCSTGGLEIPLDTFYKDKAYEELRKRALLAC